MRKQIGYLMFFVLVCAACFVLRPGVADQAAAEEHPAGSIDDLAMSLIEPELVKGLSVGVVRFDEQGNPVAKTYHFGKVHTKTGTGRSPHTPTDHTLYELGSISKVLAGTMLAVAAQKQELELGTTVASLLPETRVPSFADRPITLLDISLHRSGLPRLPDNFPAADSDDPYANYTSTKAIEFLQKAQLTKMPGKEHEYSNFAVSLLGYLLVKAAGAEDYETLLRERLTRPLDMEQTGVLLDDESSMLAVGHDASGEEVSPWHFADLPAASGIRSCVHDLNRFMIACIDPPKSDLGQAINMAFKKQADPIKDDFAMGLGWMIARDGSTRFHNGQTGGYHASMFVSRKLKLGVCVLANTANEEVDLIAERMTQMLAGMKVKVPVFEKEVVVSTEVMDRYVGQYKLAPTFIFDVRRDGERLTVGITNQSTQRVYPRSKTVWFYRGVDAALRFGELKEGKAQTVTLLQKGIEQTAERISG